MKQAQLINDISTNRKLASLTLDSRDIADMIEKQHYHLVRDIDSYIAVISENPKLDFQKFFAESSYKAKGNNKTYKCYKVTRKGCEFIANKLTGKKGILFTANYINRFHEMEDSLQMNQPSQPARFDMKGKTYKDLPRDLKSIYDMYCRARNDADDIFRVILDNLSYEHTNLIINLVRAYAESYHLQAANEMRFLMQTENFSLGDIRKI